MKHLALRCNHFLIYMYDKVYSHCLQCVKLKYFWVHKYDPRHPDFNINLKSSFMWGKKSRGCLRGSAKHNYRRHISKKFEAKKVFLFASVVISLFFSSPRWHWIIYWCQITKVEFLNNMMSFVTMLERNHRFLLLEFSSDVD